MMDPSLDRELRNDFLIEAGELLQNLDEQLVALERSPHDGESLNAVFRAFHTVKGGAGFLGLEAMVQLCHHAEDLLNEARNAKLMLGAAQMDALLEALDLLKGMMQALAQDLPLAAAPAALLRRLLPLPAGVGPAAAPIAKVEPAGAEETPPAASVTAAEAIDDSEFEALLDSLYGTNGAPGSAPPAPSAGIDDDEFDALLDSLHGRGGAPAASESHPSVAVGSSPAPSSTGAVPAVVHDAIGDDEFDALLDSLHGRGGVPGGAAPVGVESAAPGAAGAPLASAPPSRVAPVAEASVRVDTGRLDVLVNCTGELVLARNRLLSLAARSGDDGLAAATADLDRIADELQGAVLAMRMQPVGRLFQRFPRIVRDLARQLGKDIELRQEGEETDLDRSLVEALADPLVHLLRNAVDHGLELPDERERAGKPRQGVVRLAASQRGERIVITVSDDGRGMDPQLLRQKALEKGLIDAAQAARLSDGECYELIFRAGFSTAAAVSDISGRGVGMDVVKTRVAELGGTLQVRSRLGHGSELELSVPLTLAILRVLMVRVGERLLALPLGNVEEVFELADTQDRRLDGRRVAAHRGRALALGDLASWAQTGLPAGRHVVVLHIGHLRLGLLVHQVLGREDVMVKPLGRLFDDVPAIAGATVTGDGRLALVLDPAGLADASGQFLPSLKMSA